MIKFLIIDFDEQKINYNVFRVTWWNKELCWVLHNSSDRLTHNDHDVPDIIMAYIISQYKTTKLVSLILNLLHRFENFLYAIEQKYWTNSHL